MDQSNSKPKMLDLLMSTEGLEDAFLALTGAPVRQSKWETAEIVDWYTLKRRVQASIADIALKC